MAMSLLVTLVSAVIILVLLLGEFMDYRSIHLESSLIVDSGRKEKMSIDFDITFPKIPCYSKSSIDLFYLLDFLVVEFACTFANKVSTLNRVVMVRSQF
jgi:hypothetical protein